VTRTQIAETAREKNQTESTRRKVSKRAGQWLGARRQLRDATNQQRRQLKRLEVLVRNHCCSSLIHPLAGPVRQREDGGPPVFAWGRLLGRVFPARGPALLPGREPVRETNASQSSQRKAWVVFMSRHHSCRRPLAWRPLITLPRFSPCRRLAFALAHPPPEKVVSKTSSGRRMDYAPAREARTREG
jgi:hypothetical protein